MPETVELQVGDERIPLEFPDEIVTLYERRVRDLLDDPMPFEELVAEVVRNGSPSFMDAVESRIVELHQQARQQGVQGNGAVQAPPEAAEEAVDEAAGEAE